MSSRIVAAGDREIRNASKEVLLATAEDIIEKTAQESNLFDQHRENELPRFSLVEFSLGRTIGRGAFCTVTEITSMSPVSSPGVKRRGSFSFRSSSSRSLKETNSSYHGGDHKDISAKMFMASQCAKGSGKARFVLKRVAEEWIYQNRITFLKGTVDLALEAKYLAALNHPNIVNIRAVSEVGPHQEGYFIVLDRLHETFPQKLKKWTTKDRQCKGITGVIAGGKKKVTELMTSRLTAAFEIASALNYMHSRQLIYRDLKPDNLGFDVRESAKIFDFGLAKELKPEHRLESGLYNLTGVTGSIRYMAPEVGLSRPYNQHADVYSFSMLLWYILALEPPYGFYTNDMFFERVFQQGHRPVTMADWRKPIQALLKLCWDANISVRPNFVAVLKVLRAEVEVVNPEAADKLPPILEPPPRPPTPPPAAAPAPVPAAPEPFAAAAAAKVGEGESAPEVPMINGFSKPKSSDGPAKSKKKRSKNREGGRSSKSTESGKRKSSKNSKRSSSRHTNSSSEASSK